jgi:DNA-binding transcriptional LysR family regulator
VRFELRDLELFVAAVDLGSLARAAEREHTVPSAVSRRLTELERALGTPLLVRSSRGIVPTDAGAVLLDRARALLEDAHAVEDEVRAHADAERGTVRVCANASAIAEFLPAALGTFRALHPDVEIELREQVSAEVARSVLDGRADVGIAGTAVAGADCTRLQSDDLVVVVPRGHDLDRATATLADVLAHPLVLPSGDTALLRRLRAAAGREVEPRIQVAGFEAVCSVVAAGLGVAIAPRAALGDTDLALVELEEDWARHELFLCTRDPAALTPAARSLVEHLRSPTVTAA